MTDASSAPTLDFDLFSADAMAAPDQYDDLVRETAPAVYLARHGVWAVGRHADVHAVFSDWETFSSASGTGFTNIRKQGNWRQPSLILENDPPEHGKYRRLLSRILSPAVLRKLKADFVATAESIVDAALDRGEVDLVADLAEAFPFAALPDAVGFRKENRRNLLIYSELNFNAMGEKNDLYRAALERATPILDWVVENCRRDAVAPDTLGSAIFDAVDTGEITEEEAGLLVRIFISAGMDTTINGIGFTLEALARHPEAWAQLRADPTRARAAFDEGLRYRAPSPYIGRTTTREVDIGGVRIGAEEKVILFLSAANRDPRQWSDPERFDIERKTSGHLAFGFGIHACVGQMMARLEADVLMSTIASKVARIELAGKPSYQRINWLRGLSSLPVRLERA
ncbi:cytochrome P450 [Novosphingobium sp. NBM11]|uniref:cytochrome P450 n=1 Tax=Novosphingobium sp. NBM11 TaxID=2596914 RepID=UPI0018920E64|nr:cytochrome P450 [Novosphingobium sp. NBM11]